MALPKDIPTLQSTSSKNYTRPDNVFLSESLTRRVIHCEVVAPSRPPCTDHFPIATELDLSPSLCPEVRKLNFKQTEWDTYCAVLAERISLIGQNAVTTQEEMDTRAEEIRKAIQDAVDASTPELTLNIHSKRWWGKELRALAEEVAYLAPRHFRVQWDADHPIHVLFQRRRNDY
ncbi:hypothetical protein BDV93DRAFT_481420, partial [Ceratobasidium sp. AG-I]